MHQIVKVVDQTAEALYDLTTVAKVNAEFNLTSSPTNDAAVQADITENSRIIAELCGRVFALQTVVEIFRPSRGENNFESLNLSRYPVTNFESLTVGGQVMDPQFYDLNPDSGVIYFLSWYWPYWWGWWPNVATKIEANYTGGYNLPDEAPAALGRACIESIRDSRILAERTGHAGVQDVFSGDNRVRYFDIFQKGGQGSVMTAVSPMIEGLLAPYRRFAV